MVHVGTRIGMGSERGRAGIAGLAVLIALLWSGACAAQILNPSFEDTEMREMPPRSLPVDWWLLANHYHFPFTSYCTSDCTSDWPTDGALSLRMQTCVNEYVAPGDYHSYVQAVDLTGVNFIVFDVMLVGDPTWGFSPFEASFLIDGEPLWSETAEGLYPGRLVDVSGYSDLHLIELRLRAVVDYVSLVTMDCSVFWDNLAFCDRPSIIGAYIDVDPDTLNIGCNGKWGKHGKWVTCYIELDEGYDAALIDGSTVFLGDIPAYMGRECWARPEANAANMTDVDRDGIPERMVKFEWDEVEAIVEAPETVVTVGGLLLDGTTIFGGTAVIRVIDKGWPARPPYMCRPPRLPMTWWFYRPFVPPGCGNKK